MPETLPDLVAIYRTYVCQLATHLVAAEREGPDTEAGAAGLEGVCATLANMVCARTRIL